MLMIELFEETALWHDEENKWECRDKHVANLLNATIPQDINEIHIPFLEGGCQGHALAAARKMIGGNLIKIIKETESVPPQEVKGQED